jgi:hypothetical protein
MNAGNAVALVVEQVTSAGKTIADPKKKQSIGNYAAQLIDKGATDDELRAWATHYGTRLAQGARIRPSQAWEDVTNGQAVSPAALAGLPANKERNRERRSEGYEWLGEQMTDRQQVMLATVQELSREGLTTAQIVERVLGPREWEGDE